MNISLWFKSLGTDDGGMRMVMRGRRGDDCNKQITWSMFAGDGHGPNTPSVFVHSTRVPAYQGWDANRIDHKRPHSFALVHAFSA